MPAHQSPVAEVQSLVKNLPEFIFIAAGRQGHIHKVNGNNSLVKPAVKLIVAILIFPWTQGASAAHYREAVSFLKLFHLLLGNIIRHQTFCRTFCSKLCKIVVRISFLEIIFFQNIDQFRKCRGHPDSRLILYTFVSLFQSFLYDHCQVLFLGLCLCFVKIHEYCKEGGLAVCCHQCDHLVFDGLNALCNLLFQPSLNDLI